MVRRVANLVAILLTLGMPYMIFLIISYFSIPPKYHFRIAFFIFRRIISHGDDRSIPIY